MAEKDIHALNLIISNLQNFSSKADSLLMRKSKSISYPDFFDQYREYIQYLKSLDFEANEITDLLKSTPNIPRIGFSLLKLLILMPFFLYLVIIHIYLLLLIWIPILIGVAVYFFINERRKYKMSEIITFNSRLINLLQEKVD